MYSFAWFTYYFNLLVAYGNYYVAHIYQIFREYPLEVRIAAFFISFSLTAIFLICISIYMKSRTRAYYEKTMKRFEERYGSSIEYLFSDDCPDGMPKKDMIILLGIGEEVKNKKDLLTSKKEKRIFSHFVYFKRISSEAANTHRNNLRQLLQFFGLHEFLETEVSLANNGKKCDALQILRTFKLYISPWLINKLLDSKNLYIQRLAMYTAIMSSSDSDLDYFETTFFDDNCCILDEVELGYLLQRRRNHGMQLPNLANWAYQQKNPPTQCIFVRLMRRFDQREYCMQLEDLFKNSHHKKLIEEISRTWGYLHYKDGEQLLIDSWLMQPDDTKVAIMHAVTRMATGNSLGMLTTGFQSSTNPHVRFEALRCLYNYGEEGKSRFEALEASSKEQDQKFFSFFHNPITLGRIGLDKEQAYHPSVETLYNSDL